ncbi:hypothetical protein BJ912DRAFT_938556, partial [Pholiota molesta]
MFSFRFVAAVVVAAVISARAETHTITFNNRRMRHGNSHADSRIPSLVYGTPYTHSGPITAAIAYLQTGPCLFNGEGCTLVETTLVNPTAPGSGSSSDISLIPPHAFNVAAGFNYNNGCSGGADCTGPIVQLRSTNPMTLKS